MSALRKLSPALIALLVLLAVASLAYGSKSARPSVLTPIYVPVPTQDDIIPCNPYSTFLIRFNYWTRPGDAHYIARFEAEGGPGRVFLRTSTEADVHLDIPANSSPAWYKLDLYYPDLATLPDDPENESDDIELLFGGSSGACGYVTSATPDALVQVRHLNIFVSP